MTRIDELVLSKAFSPLAGWAEHRLGFSQWRISLECLNGHLAFYLGGLALSLGGKGMDDGIFAEILVALAWLLLMEGARRIACRQAGSSLGVQTARMREWLFRVILLVSLPISVARIDELANAFYSAALLLLVCHLYFKACDSPPPQGRRLAHARGR
ncbi:MAG TPA: hypothetical protein VFP12_09135 [Allosphingosinicella sp.]|nr:hypothetical protein [Allosphingosinicella sp.]